MIDFRREQAPQANIGAALALFLLIVAIVIVAGTAYKVANGSW